MNGLCLSCVTALLSTQDIIQEHFIVEVMNTRCNPDTFHSLNLHIPSS